MSVTVSVEILLEALADAMEKRNEIAGDLDSQIRDLEEIRAACCFDIDQKIDGLKSNIVSSVLSTEESTKGSRLHAVYSKGRTTWNSKLLQGYAVAHPEINAMRETGNPSVSIRPVK